MPSAPTITARRSKVAVAASAFGFGFGPFLATRAFDAGVDPVAASFLRIALLFVALLPCAPRLRGWRRESAIVFAGGALSTLGFAGYFMALDAAPVAAATVVYYTYPVVVLVLSAVVWKRAMRFRDVALAAMLLLGVGLCVGPSELDAALIVALLPAFAAPLGWAIYLIVLSGPAAPMPTVPKILAGAAGGVVVLFPFAFARTGGHLAPFTMNALTAVGLLALCTLAIPAALVTWGSPAAGDRATAMIGSLEFTVALAVGWLLMGNSFGPIQLLGVGLVCIAVGIASRSPAQQPPTQISTSSSIMALSA